MVPLWRERAEGEAVTSVRVATWNVRKCVGLDRRRNPHRVAEVIADLEADVVAVQEADKRLGSRPAALTPEIVERETGMVPVDAGGHEASIGWHGNAVLMSREMEVTARHALHLPGLEPRGALILDFNGKGRGFRFVAVHLGLLRASRRSQLAAIRSKLESMEALPTVILGDFNEWSEDRGLEPLSEFSVHTPGRTFHSARPVAALDRIALSNDVELRDAKVVTNNLTRVASDHLPIVGQVAVAGVS